MYIYKKNGINSWDFIAKLSPADAEPYDEFGRSVAMYQDTVVIGAPLHEVPNSAIDSGAVYLFSKAAGGTWEEVMIIKPNNLSSLAHFGYSVDLKGSYMALGSPSESAGGSVYTFEQVSSPEWKELLVLKIPDINEQFLLGYSVSIGGSFIMAGSPGSLSETGKRSGNSYVFY